MRSDSKGALDQILVLQVMKVYVVTFNMSLKVEVAPKLFDVLESQMQLQVFSCGTFLSVFTT